MVGLRLRMKQNSDSPWWHLEDCIIMLLSSSREDPWGLCLFFWRYNVDLSITIHFSCSNANIHFPFTRMSVIYTSFDHIHMITRNTNLIYKSYKSKINQMGMSSFIPLYLKWRRPSQIHLRFYSIHLGFIKISLKLLIANSRVNTEFHSHIIGLI